VLAAFNGMFALQYGDVGDVFGAGSDGENRFLCARPGRLLCVFAREIVPAGVPWIGEHQCSVADGLLTWVFPRGRF